MQTAAAVRRPQESRTAQNPAHAAKGLGGVVVVSKSNSRGRRRERNRQNHLEGVQLSQARLGVCPGAGTRVYTYTYTHARISTHVGAFCLRSQPDTNPLGKRRGERRTDSQKGNIPPTPDLLSSACQSVPSQFGAWELVGSRAPSLRSPGFKWRPVSLLFSPSFHALLQPLRFF